ncbi:MAG: FeoB-associated Cys-rich membrane protein [Lachnospiraceae bacterium]|nr:FeoB-associated Cys-rich membrane protein [Lachnospiraceae bacterium]
MSWLMQNLGTIIPAVLVFGIAALAARSVWKNKKAGKCCGSCGGCSCGDGSHRCGHGADL